MLFGETPLSIFIENQLIDRIQLLLDSGANPNYCSFRFKKNK